MRILIVEDEKKLNAILQRCLQADGFAVEGVHTAADAMARLSAEHCDLMVLDLQLPDGSGGALLRRMREDGHDMPVLVLTANDGLECKLETFGAGADDYVVKPVAMAELSIRVQALLRRGAALRESVLKAADLEINRLTRQVKRNGARIDLSPKEYSLLEYLSLHAGRAVSRDMILERLWDQSFEGLSNIVDVYIGHLRRKIDEGREPKLIHTVRGKGYMLEAGAP